MSTPRPLLAAALIGVLVNGPPLMGAALLDRVLATVEGRVITLSDVRAAQRLGLVNVAGAGDAAAAALDRLIDRTVILIEVERYAPPEPDPSAVSERVGAVKARLGSPEQLAAALQLSGLDEASLDAWARNDLRIERYLQDRFAGAAEPTDEDIDGYLRRHEGDLARSGRAPNDPEARRQAREQVALERRAALVSEWVQSLRDRATISVPPPLRN
jgi:hypothetical protein